MLPLITFVVGVVVIFALQLFLSKAPLGRAMRAASDDPDTVPLMGIDNRRVYALSTAHRPGNRRASPACSSGCAATSTPTTARRC